MIRLFKSAKKSTVSKKIWGKKIYCKKQWMFRMIKRRRKKKSIKIKATMEKRIMVASFSDSKTRKNMIIGRKKKS